MVRLAQPEVLDINVGKVGVVAFSKSLPPGATAGKVCKAVPIRESEKTFMPVATCEETSVERANGVTIRDTGQYSARNSSKGALIDEAARIFNALSAGANVEVVREQSLRGSQTPTGSPRGSQTHRLTGMASQEVGCLHTLGKCNRRQSWAIMGVWKPRWCDLSDEASSSCIEEAPEGFRPVPCEPRRPAFGLPMPFADWGDARPANPQFAGAVIAE